MAKLFDPPQFIAIEGPIRVGKSTLAGILAEKLHARRIIEPDENPFLAQFYAGDKSTAFETQMWFLMQRYAQMRDEKDRGIQTAPVIADYLFEKDKIFACLNLNDDELALYNRYYALLRKELPTPDLVIYLRASTDVLKQRLKRKGIPEEREISDRYVEEVSAAYEHFFFHYSQSDLLVIDTSQIDFVQKNSDLQLLLQRLEEPIKGKQYFLPLSPMTETQKTNPVSPADKFAP